MFLSRTRLLLLSVFLFVLTHHAGFVAWYFIMNPNWQTDWTMDMGTGFGIPNMGNGLGMGEKFWTQVDYITKFLLNTHEGLYFPSPC